MQEQRDLKQLAIAIKLLDVQKFQELREIDEKIDFYQRNGNDELAEYLKIYRKGKIKY